MTGDRDATTSAETSVPEWQTAERCRYCDRPLPDEQRRTLHEGLVHWDRLSASERDAYERAAAAEMEAFEHFRLAVLAVGFVLLQVLFFAFRAFT